MYHCYYDFLQLDYLFRNEQILHLLEGTFELNSTYKDLDTIQFKHH